MMLGGLLDRHQRNSAMNKIEKLVREYETDSRMFANRLHLVDPRIAYRNCLVFYSFICGNSLNNVGENFPFVLIGLIVFGIIFFIGIKIYLDKENSSRLENWQTAKLESIDKIIKVDPKFESFRLKNPSYDLYSDASAHCIQEVSFGVTIYQMIEINSSIRKNMKSTTIN